MASLGHIPGDVRKMVAITCYLPPAMAAQRGRACLEYIADLVIKYKRKYSSPYIVVAG